MDGLLLGKWDFLTRRIFFDDDNNKKILDTETQYEKAIGNVTRAYGKEYPFDLKRKLLSFCVC